LHEPAGRYAVAGIITAGVAIAWAIAALMRDELLTSPASTLTFVLLDLTLACLLLGAMSRPPVSPDVWGARRGRRMALLGVILAPVATVTLVGVSDLVSNAEELLLGAQYSNLLARLARGLLGHLVPWMIALSVWFFEWRWFIAMRRALFDPQQR
jgi:hypothetical protein